MSSRPCVRSSRRQRVRSAETESAGVSSMKMREREISCEAKLTFWN